MVVCKGKGSKFYSMDFYHKGRRVHKKIPTTRKRLAEPYESNCNNSVKGG